MMNLSPLEPQNFYHVYNRANGWENLFAEHRNYAFFMRRMLLYGRPYFDIAAYCLIPNHFHLLIKTKGDVLDDSFAQKAILSLRKAFISYAKSYNSVYERKGSLFKRAVRRKWIRSDQQIVNVINYIHANPVNHGLCDNIEEWPYSSIHAYRKNHRDVFINKKTLAYILADMPL